MDSGAHFHRCDFQVHGPRDLAWSGRVPTTEEERRKCAEAIIASCREKGLHAIAVTDHHDTVFIRYVKEAARVEIDSEGKPLKDADRMIVFPGIELTLGVPCQALLLFDAEFPVEFMSQIELILSISQAPQEEPKQLQLTRLEHFKSLNDVCEELDKRDFARGRYVLLPNLGDNRKFCMLRKGMASHYKQMICVGGYIDGSYEALEQGIKDILEGRSKEWGSRRTAVIQTSDNRREDCADLGRHTTWIKWATPTAEAMRQAFLASQTRLANAEPLLPALVIERLEVSNSKFLGPIDLALNPQLNCLIGGRGTGKSTILEYLRWALCDQPPLASDDDEMPDLQRKRAALIENTLKPLDAVATATFTLNGAPHVVRRSSKTGQVLLKIGEDEFMSCSEDTVRDLLGIQAYSQKQLSTVGVRAEELVRFVRAPIAKALRDFDIAQEAIRGEIRRAYGLIQEKRLLAREQAKERFEADSLTKQLEGLRAELKGLSEEDRNVLKLHESYLEEERFVKDVTTTLGEWRSEITATSKTIDINLGQVKNDLPDKSEISSIQKLLTKVHGRVRQTLALATKQLEADADDVKDIVRIGGEIDAKVKKHTEKYEAAKSRAATHESKLKLIAQAEGRLKVLRDGIADKERRLAKCGNPEDAYADARSRWAGLYADRADSIENKCDELTKLSEKRIRATLHRGAGLEAARDRLALALSGSKLRGKKIEELSDFVAQSSDPVATWNQVVSELESLALLEPAQEGRIDVPVCATLAKGAFGIADMERVARHLSVEHWLEVSLVELSDVPVFEYRQREGEYIGFSDASAGQQATALLRVLLNREGPPLVIDQPEEDLDNPVILEIVEDIWEAKRKRQIMFSSHNANIVVNGDADLVICCDYRTAGDHSGGRVKLAGAIDIPLVRKEITIVMEGGEEAFRLRKEKYGF